MPPYPHWLLDCAIKIYKGLGAGIRSIFDRSYFSVWNPVFLEKSQWFSQEDIQRLQLEGLKQLVDYARKNTKYYKNIPSINSLEDLKNIPVLTKRTIRENFNHLRAASIPGYEVKTSGTVSRSTTVNDNRLEFDFGQQRFQKWSQYPIKRICNLYDVQHGLQHGRMGRYLNLSIDHLREREDALYYLKLIKEFKPDLIWAFASPMRFLAHYALEEGVRPRIGVIQTSFENLDEEARKDIEEAFQCEVYNFYGSSELRSIAQDCEFHEDLHINAERYIVEEEDGQLLFTDLLNYAMPLIRYKNQDTGRISSRRCSCGRGLPTMQSLIGRSFDYLLTKKDTWVSSHAVGHFLAGYSEFDWVEAFQFKQTEKGKIIVLVKPWSQSKRIPNVDILTNLLYRRVSKEEIDISIEVVDSLVRSRSGKIQRVLTDFSPWN